jgi:hypothetical protein
MKFIVLALILVAALVGFSHNYRQEAQNEWQAFENKFNKPLSDLIGESPATQEAQTFSSPAAISQPLKTEVIEEVAYQPTDRDPLTFLSDEIQTNPLFAQLTDFDLDELDLLESKQVDLQAMQDLATQIVNQLTACIKDSSCIEELGDKYQDINQMRSLQLLERTLYVALALQDLDSNSQAVNANMIHNLLTVPSAPIHYVALEILGQQRLQDQDFNSLIALSAQLPVESKGHLYSRLEREAQESPSRRLAYLNSMSNEITKNSETALEILKHLPFIDLSAKELTTLSKSLCHYGSPDVDQKAQWDMIQFHHGQYNERKGLGIKLNSLCGQ